MTIDAPSPQVSASFCPPIDVVGGSLVSVSVSVPVLLAGGSLVKRTDELVGWAAPAGKSGVSNRRRSSARRATKSFGPAWVPSEWTPKPAPVVGAVWIQPHPDGTFTYRHQAEADDLAAWLSVPNRCGWDLDSRVSDDDVLQWRIWLQDLDPDAWHPTIRGALVAAVRKVAER